MVGEIRELDEVGVLQLSIPAEVVYDLKFTERPGEPLLRRLLMLLGVGKLGSVWARLPAT